MASTQAFTVNDFCKRVACHCLIDWAEARTSFAKCWWALFMFTSVFVLGYQIFMEVYEFYTDPVQTTMSFVPVTSLKFPQVYICPLSFFDKRCVKNWTVFEQETAVFKLHNGSILDVTGSTWQSLVPDLPGAPGFPQKDRNSVAYQCPQGQGYLKDIAISVFDYFVQCTFNSENVICDCIAESYVDKEYGVCYLVDVSKTITKHYGEQTTDNIGLRLLLDVHSDYQPDINDGEGAKFTPLLNGAIVRVENPIDPSSFGGILVQAGTYTSIVLEARKLSLIDDVDSSTPQHCTSNGQARLKYFTAAYSIELCRLDCAQMIINETCGCAMPFDRKFVKSEFWNVGNCSRNDLESCVNPTIKIVGLPQMKIQQCAETCYRACDTWEYKTSLSQLTLPNLNTQKTKFPGVCPQSTNHSIHDPTRHKTEIPDSTLPTPPTTETVGLIIQGPTQEPAPLPSRPMQDHILLDIAFSKLQYMQIQQSPPKSITTLLSNIGGQAGLWTGASVFTVLQLLVFAGYLVYSKYNLDNRTN